MNEKEKDEFYKRAKELDNKYNCLIKRLRKEALFNWDNKLNELIKKREREKELFKRIMRELREDIQKERRKKRTITKEYYKNNKELQDLKTRKKDAWESNCKANSEYYREQEKLKLEKEKLK